VFAFARHLIRAVALLARDGRIPRPLRWLAVLGLLPIPGPVDEFVLLVVGVLLFVFYRDVVREASIRAGVSPGDRSPSPAPEQQR
jgi:hypothetical protein